MKPETGKEYIQPNEARDTQEIIDTIISRLKRDYKPGQTLRQFHAKMHGCVKATFTVADNIPENFRYGIFIPGKVYDAWIRFSNGNTHIVDDRKGDLRGMAIKLLDVPGDVLTQDPVLPQSQDFLLVSYPTLMSATVAAFKKNIKALCNGPLAMVSFALNPGNWGALVRTLQSMKKCGNLFLQQYWSVVPSKLGSDNQAVKYTAIPDARSVVQKIDKSDPDFLRKVMQQELSAQDFKFDFMVQLQEDPVTMPIENPCVKWHSAWHKVATIRIQQQLFDTAERNNFGEHLSFNPWHSLEAHRPLSGISRARKAAYDAISKYRLTHNQQV
ncbi:catalase family protein [Chitinophagaceae bacterium MMS25-I14]